MSEMVERVALAISGGDDPASILSIHRSRARAAIEAMREPTKPMIWAAYEEDRTKAAADDSNIDFAAGCWRAMIDAALAVTNGDHK